MFTPDPWPRDPQYVTEDFDRHDEDIRATTSIPPTTSEVWDPIVIILASVVAFLVIITAIIFFYAFMKRSPAVYVFLESRDDCWITPPASSLSTPSGTPNPSVGLTPGHTPPGTPTYGRPSFVGLSQLSSFTATSTAKPTDAEVMPVMESQI